MTLSSGTTSSRCAVLCKSPEPHFISLYIRGKTGFSCSDLLKYVETVTRQNKLCRILRRLKFSGIPWKQQEQCAFCPGCGKQECAWEFVKSVYMCVLDLEKAFNCVSPSCCWGVLQGEGDYICQWSNASAFPSDKPQQVRARSRLLYFGCQLSGRKWMDGD